LLRRIFLWLIFIALQPEDSQQLGRQRVAVGTRVAGPADESRVLELLDVRQVA